MTIIIIKINHCLIIEGCICNCLDNFYGPDCGSFNLTVLATAYDPVECNDLECGFMGPDSEIYGYCPVKCICKYFEYT